MLCFMRKAVVSANKERDISAARSEERKLPSSFGFLNEKHSLRLASPFHFLVS